MPIWYLLALVVGACLAWLTTRHRKRKGVPDPRPAILPRTMLPLFLGVLAADFVELASDPVFLVVATGLYLLDDYRPQVLDRFFVVRRALLDDDGKRDEALAPLPDESSDVETEPPGDPTA